MGFWDSSSSRKGGVPTWLRKDYEKFGLDPDNEAPWNSSDDNSGKKMYCPRCGSVYNGGYKCRECGNLLVEWH